MARKQQRPPPPKPLCAYCGARPAVTKDHVIPECLFTVMPIVGTITVKACRECNQEKARDEHYLADILQSYYTSHEHPVARELAEGRVLRSARYHTSDHVRDIIRELQSRELDPDPYALRTVTVDADRIMRVLQFITRGLYAHYRKPMRLPGDCIIGVTRISDKDIATILPRLVSLTPYGPYTLGDDVATIRYGVSEQDPIGSLWVIAFYRSVVYATLTKQHNS